ncbi:MAG: hypothetical protein GY769_20090 [bacterium]|nr:hypothetical protein [bacterium]
MTNIYEELNEAIGEFEDALERAGLLWPAMIEVPCDPPLTVRWNHRENDWSLSVLRTGSKQDWQPLLNGNVAHRVAVAQHTDLIIDTIMAKSENDRAKMREAIATWRRAAAELGDELGVNQ